MPSQRMATAATANRRATPQHLRSNSSFDSLDSLLDDIYDSVNLSPEEFRRRNRCSSSNMQIQQKQPLMHNRLKQRQKQQEQHHQQRQHQQQHHQQQNHFGREKQFHDSQKISEFLQVFRKGTGSCISSAYAEERAVENSAMTGNVTTSLAEDIFYIVDVQLKILHDFLVSNELLCTDTGEEVLVDGLLSTFRYLWSEQARNRMKFLTTLESCCAAANDFTRMADHLDDLMRTLEKKYPHLEWNAFEGEHSRTVALRREAQDLAATFGCDAVFAAQRIHLFVMDAVYQESSIQADLFNREWEDRYTHNEVILTLVRTFEDFSNDIQNYLGTEYLYHKVVNSLARSTATFYIRVLVLKAIKVRASTSRRSRIMNRNKKKDSTRLTTDQQMQQQLPFASPSRALCRMMYDIQVLQNYFRNIAKACPRSTLKQDVANELSILTLIHEFLSLAVNHSGPESLEEFIIVIHKYIGTEIDVTKLFLSDLWYLTAPGGKRNLIHVAVGMVRAELQLVSERSKDSNAQRQHPEGIIRNNDQYNIFDSKDALSQLDEMLKSMYEDRIWQDKMSRWAPCLKA